MPSRTNGSIREFYATVFAHPSDPAMVDSVVAPSLRSHDWSDDIPNGPAGFTMFYDHVRSSLPDMEYAVDDIVCAGDRVVVRWRLMGTHEADFAGLPPTGRHVEMKGIAIYLVEAVLLAERWVVFDLHGLLAQMQTG